MSKRTAIIPMTKKIRHYLLIIVAAACLACLCAFAGCKIGDKTRDEVLEDFGGANIVYYANGGRFNELPDNKVSDVYFKPSENASGIPFFDVTDSTLNLKVDRKDYDLVGWFLAETYAEGPHAGEAVYSYLPDGQTESVTVYPVKDQDGNLVKDSKTDRPVFAREGVDEKISENAVTVVASAKQMTSADVVADDSKIIVCAVWHPSLKVKYIFVCEDEITVGDKTYRTGDTIREDVFGKLDTFSPTSLEPAEIEGATFLKTYLDAECTQPVSVLQRPEGENPEDLAIYSKYIKGVWTVVTNTTASVRNMFNGLGDNKKFYVMEDLDSKVTVSLRNGNTFKSRAQIYGNGHTVSNVTFNMGTSTANNGANLSPFGVLEETFAIRNIIFKDFAVDVTGKGNLTLYAFATSVHESATFENFVINGMKVTAKVPANSLILNAQNGSTANLLFGGAASDEAFLQSHGGVSVTGQITLNEDEN